MARKSTKSTKSSDGPRRHQDPEDSRPPKAAKPQAPRRRRRPSPKTAAPAGGAGRTLVIVESPKKAKSINKFLGSGYVVKASMGHVRDLPKRKLGLDVDHGYEPSYEIMPAKKETIADLKREAAKADMVYLATDPDREGEAIAWHLQEALGLPDERVRRVTFHEITERAVKEAFNHVGPINMDMVNAQQARRFLDRFVGYQLSPLLWKKVARHLSAGRVQSVAVRLIADREKEIRAFVSEEYWKITATVEPGRLDRPRPTGSRPRWPSGKGAKFEAKNEADAHAIRDALAVGRLRGRRGRGGREARQGRRPVQDQHAPAAGGDPPAVLGQADDEGRPGALRRDRRRRHGPGRPDHLHADRQPPRLGRGDRRPSAT